MANQDDDLTKRAIDSLIKDAEQWQKRRDREFRATQQKQTSLNKVYLKNLLSNNENHNDRIKMNMKLRRHNDVNMEKGVRDKVTTSANPDDRDKLYESKKSKNLSLLHSRKQGNISGNKKSDAPPVGATNVIRSTKYIDCSLGSRKPMGLKIEIGFRKHNKEPYSMSKNVKT